MNTTGTPLTLPDGFSISIFAEDLGKPHVMTYDPAGNLIVSIPASGKAVALPDKNNDDVANEAITLLDKLIQPHGLAVKTAEKTVRLFVKH